MFCQPLILFGVERLMKYKLKTRLFAALALSGVSFYWPASGVLAQEDDFGFIRPAEPSRQDEQEQSVPPITQATPLTAQVTPPIVSGTLNSGVRSPNALVASVRPPATVPPIVTTANRQAAGKASAPMPFAASNVFNGAYVESGTANVGYAQHVSPSQTGENASAQQVAYNEPAGAANQPPIVSGIQAQRDLPPIVNADQPSERRFTPQIVQPIQQNELPPILSSAQVASNSAVPPIVAPKAGLERLLSPVSTNIAQEKTIQDEFLLSANEAAMSEASKVEPAAFGVSPMLIQDAPPTTDGIVDSIVPGSLPSARGVLVPADPAVDVPFEGSAESFPRATPLDSANAAPRSLLGSGTRIEPATGSGTRNAPTYFDPSVQQMPAHSNPAVGGCSTCGSNGGSCGCSGAGGCNGTGVSACNSCDGNNCFDQAAVDAMFNTSGSNAYARRYLITEALYLGRSDGDIFNSNRGSLSDFDFEAGARITVGRREDSTSGREFQYTGTDKIGQTIDSFDAGGNIQSLFVPTGGLDFFDTASFFNATEQSQSKETYFHSLEFNKVKWGWDVIKSYVGLRYIYLDDEYTLFSQSRQFSVAGGDAFDLDAQSGRFQIGTTNNLIGPHIGGELYYDVGYRVSLSGFSRLGAYVNFSELNETLDNDGVRQIDTEDTNVTVSYSYEIGLNAKYRLTRQSQFRLGYNLYFWDRLATVSDNIVNNGGGIAVGPSLFGDGTSDSDSVFFNGVSFGFEFYR